MRTASKFTWLLGALPWTLIACGGGGSSSGGGGGTIVGLTMPDEMGLVDVDEATAGGTVSAGAGSNPAASFPADSDYNQDEVHAHMWDSATEPLDIINEILTAVSQTRADEFVNEGAYVALVEMVGKDGDDAASTGQSSSANATELEPWTILSTRASATAAQIVRFWITEEEDFGGGTPMVNQIFGKATVTEEPSDTKPYGSFGLDFAFVNLDTEQMFERGRLATVPASGGELGFTFIMDDVLGFFGGDTKVSVRTNAAKTAGRAHMYVPDWEMGGMQTFTMAYNADYFLRSNGTTTKLLDRNNLRRNTWGYNLYHAEDGDGHLAGDRLDMIGGFPFRYTVTGQEHPEFGWCDYWGIWSSNPDTLTDGMTVTRDDGPGSSATEYTVVKAPGKLIKVTKQEIPLSELDGESFEFWDWETGNQYLTTYTHSTTTWMKVAQRDQENWEWVDLETPSELTIQEGWWYGFWSMAFGGCVDFIGGQTSVVVRDEDFVSADDSIFGGGTSLTLYSMQESLRAGINQTQADQGDVFMTDVWDAANAYEYTFLKSTRSLQYGGANVGYASGVTPQGGPFDWGMRSGPMVSTDPVTLGITEPWELWNQTTYYMYETGHNEWNQYATLLDTDGDPVTFDDPISFFYTHATANDADGSADHDGKKVFLTYGGTRNLWGIPGEDVDMDGDGYPDRWYPLFSIADGTVLGPTGTEYVVKAVDIELFMEVSTDPVPTELTTGLTNASELTLPTISAWTDPTGVAEPTVTDDPKVVAGVIQ